MSKIITITGPMFSNKSTMLIHHIDFLKHIGKRKIYYIKSIYGEDYIESRQGKKVFANSFPIDMNINEYSEYLDAFRNYDMDAVIIDEAQFFGSWVVDFCFKLRLMGIEVIVAGLDMDAFGNPFNTMGKLMCISDIVEKKTAACEICGAEAPFTIKKNDNPSQISIGGDEKYEARCTKHLNT